MNVFFGLSAQDHTVGESILQTQSENSGYSLVVIGCGFRPDRIIKVYAQCQFLGELGLYASFEGKTAALPIVITDISMQVIKLQACAKPLSKFTGVTKAVFAFVVLRIAKARKRSAPNTQLGWQ